MNALPERNAWNRCSYAPGESGQGHTHHNRESRHTDSYALGEVAAFGILAERAEHRVSVVV